MWKQQQGFRGRQFSKGYNRTFKNYRYGHQEKKHYSKHTMEYFNQLFNSDIALDELDAQQRIWVAQLIENALAKQATYIEIFLFELGWVGFDVLDDGIGIAEEEFESLVKCRYERQHNQEYKWKSLGEHGEALWSLNAGCSLTVMSRHQSQAFGWKVTFDENGDVKTKEVARMEHQGTIIQVRDIHKNHERNHNMFRLRIKYVYNHTIALINQFSLILPHIKLMVLNETVQKKKNKKTKSIIQQKLVQTKWETQAPQDALANIQQILTLLFGKKFPEIPKETVRFDTKFRSLEVTIFFVKPVAQVLEHEAVFLTRKNFHHYMNFRPVDIPAEVKTIFYELYQAFKVKDKSLPFVMVHFQTQDFAAYEVALALDVRTVHFKEDDRNALAAQLKQELTEHFLKLIGEQTKSEQKSILKKSAYLTPEESKLVSSFNQKFASPESKVRRLTDQNTEMNKIPAAKRLEDCLTNDETEESRGKASVKGYDIVKLEDGKFSK